MSPRTRIIVTIVVAIIIIVVVLQNTQPVETRLLVVTVTMPRAVLLFVTLVAGFALGLVAARWLSRSPAEKDRG